jgi:RNA polymerase sigma-70 factor (ECF subfamily)
MAVREWLLGASTELRRKWFSGTIIGSGNYSRLFALAGGYNSRHSVAALRVVARGFMLKPPIESEVTTLLQRWSNGDQLALEELTPIVYEELRRLARRYMRGERANLTLQTTALVNEAYLRLVDLKRMRFNDRAHFFAVSAQLMRRILVDHARRRNLKRGAGVEHISLDEVASFGLDRDAGLVMLDDAMVALARFDPRKAQVVELRFFGGLSVEETAEVLKISPITVMRDWSTARAWLYRELSGASSQPAQA